MNEAEELEYRQELQRTNLYDVEILAIEGMALRRLANRNSSTQIKKGFFEVKRGLWLDGAEPAPDGYEDSIGIASFLEGPTGVLICVAKTLGFKVFCRNTNYSRHVILERRGISIDIGGNGAPEAMDPLELFEFACRLISLCRNRGREILAQAEDLAAPEWATVTIDGDAQARINHQHRAWDYESGYDEHGSPLPWCVEHFGDDAADPPRPGARGPAPDHDTDRRIIEIRDCLKAWGFSGGIAQVAAVLSVERGERVTADAVRARIRRLA